MTRPPAVYRSTILGCHAITASGGISLAVMLDDVGVAASSLVDVSVVSDGKFCDVEAVISDVAEGPVGADAVAPLA